MNGNSWRWKQGFNVDGILEGGFMKNGKMGLILLMLLSLALIAGGCAETKTVTKKEEAPVKEVKPAPEPKPEPRTEVVEPISPAVEGMAREEIETAPAVAVQTFADVHFDFDRYDIKPEDRPTLNSLSDWLVSNGSASVLVEGHCDERGTNEYNLALGERRATAIKDYLAASGVDRSRISTISYGEERPLDPGHNEAAWAKNRRGHFVIKK